jgi:hypothetical protein
VAAIVRSMQQAALTAGGPTQDYEISGAFSASEPLKAAMVWSAPSTTAGTTLDHGRFSIGFTDGTRQRCVSIRSRDNATTTSCVRQAVTDSMLWIYSATATSVAGQMALSSLASNKLVGTWATLPPAAWLVNCLQFGGSDITAYCGDFTTSGTEGATVNVTDPNFEPDLILFASRITAVDGTSGQHAVISIGYACWESDGTLKQGCLSFSDEDNLGAPNTRIGFKLEEGRVARQYNVGGPTEGSSAAVAARLSNGFSVDLLDGATATNLVYLAIRSNGALRYTSDSNTTRTTTGTQTFSPGIAPQAILGLFTHTLTLNSLDTGATAGSWGVGVATGTSEEMCSAYMSQDDIPTSNTKCLTSAVFSDVPLPGGGAGTIFDLSAVGTDATLNYTTVDGTASQMLLLTISRSLVRGPAKTTAGALGKASGAAVHKARAVTAPVAASRAAGIKKALARGVSSIGAVLRAIPSLVSGGGSTTLTAIADARVNEANPTSNAGSDTSMRVREAVGGSYHCYVRFDASSISGTITSATLRLWVTDGSDVGGVVYPTDGSWAEGTITWNNAPGNTGASIASLGSVSTGTWAEWDVTSAVTAAQIDFVLKSTSSDSCFFDTREGTNPPELVIVTSGGGTTLFGRGFILAGSLARALGGLVAGGRSAVAPGAATQAVGAGVHGARAQTDAGALERAAGIKPAAGRASSTSGAVERSIGAALHQARGATAVGSEERAQASAAHGARAASTAGEVATAKGSKSALGRGVGLAGSVLRAVASLVVAGGSTLFGRGVSAAGAVARAVGLHVATGRASGSAGSIERAAGAGRHAGRGQARAGDEARALGTAQHIGRARGVAGSAERAAGQGLHAARATVAAGGVSKGRAVHAALARAMAAAGALLRAAPSKITPGVVVGRAIATAGALMRAIAAVPHRARGRSLAGMVDPTAPTVVHKARGRTQAGSLARAILGRPFVVRAIATAGAIVRAVAAKIGRAGARDAAGVTERARPVKKAGGRVSASTLALAKAQARAVHRARARTLTDSGSRAIYSRVVLGFYSRTSKAIRSRWRTQCATPFGIPTQYPNLPFVQPAGVLWARISVEYQDFDEAARGGAGATYIVPGSLHVELRAPVLLGVKALHEKADAIAAVLQRQESNGIVYGMASIGDARAEADDFRLRIAIPFRSADLLFIPEGSTAGGSSDFEGSEAAIRARFRERITDAQAIPTSHDNLPPDQAAQGTWIKLRIIDAGAFDVDGVRRSSGVMLAEVHVPVETGEAACLEAADRVVESFRMVSTGPVRFSFPHLRNPRREMGEWVLPVYCPWTADHA